MSKLLAMINFQCAVMQCAIYKKKTFRDMGVHGLYFITSAAKCNK